jgi:hypothetical protein
VTREQTPLPVRDDLKDLHEVGPQARWLRELRARLSAVAPIWTSRILGDPAAAGDPADFDAAWQWRQLDSWVRAALGGQSPAQLRRGSRNCPANGGASSPSW